MKYSYSYSFVLLLVCIFTNRFMRTHIYISVIVLYSHSDLNTHIQTHTHKHTHAHTHTHTHIVIINFILKPLEDIIILTPTFILTFVVILISRIALILELKFSKCFCKRKSKQRFIMRCYKIKSKILEFNKILFIFNLRPWNASSVSHWNCIITLNVR